RRHGPACPTRRSSDLPTGFSLLAALEAGSEAMTGTIEDRRRIALVVAGENLSRQLSFTMTEKFRKDPSYVSPRYAYQFWDSELRSEEHTSELQSRFDI